MARSLEFESKGGNLPGFSAMHLLCTDQDVLSGGVGLAISTKISAQLVLDSTLHRIHKRNISSTDKVSSRNLFEEEECESRLEGRDRCWQRCDILIPFNDLEDFPKSGVLTDHR